MSKCSRCDGGGWMWPNLGVNCPAGAAWAIAGSQGRMQQMYGASFYIQCDVCNLDGHKPHPEQDKIDAAKEIDLQASKSDFRHALLFDGTSLVDTWSATPKKYAYRKSKASVEASESKPE